MSVDYDDRERVFYAGIEARFRSLGSLVNVETEAILETAVAAYKKDLQAMDAKTRVLDDIVAIAKSGDSPPAEKYRKVVQVLVAKGLVEN